MWRRQANGYLFGVRSKLSKKLIYAKAETKGEDGKVVAEAQAKLMVI